MCRYLDIRDEAILKVYNERRAHQMWMKSLNLLTDEENLTLYTKLDNAADNAANEEFRHELTDIVAELLFLAYGE